jgi:hypothetical protein
MKTRLILIVAILSLVSLAYGSNKRQLPTGDAQIIGKDAEPEEEEIPIFVIPESNDANPVSTFLHPFGVRRNIYTDSIDGKARVLLLNGSSCPVQLKKRAKAERTRGKISLDGNIESMEGLLYTTSRPVNLKQDELGSARRGFLVTTDYMKSHEALKFTEYGNGNSAVADFTMPNSLALKISKKLGKIIQSNVPVAAFGDELQYKVYQVTFKPSKGEHTVAIVIQKPVGYSYFTFYGYDGNKFIDGTWDDGDDGHFTPLQVSAVTKSGDNITVFYTRQTKSYVKYGKLDMQGKTDLTCNYGSLKIINRSR